VGWIWPRSRSAPSCDDTATNLASRENGGFTLIELLVALAITALIATFAIMGIELSRRAWTISRDFDAQSQIDAGLGRLSDLLSKTAPSAALDPKRGIASLLFRGNPDELTFVTLSEGYALRGGLILAELKWIPPGVNETDDEIKNGTIRLTASVFRPAATAALPGPPVTLLRNATGLRLRYFGATAAGKPPAWQADWLMKDRLPIAIGVEIDLIVQNKPRHIQLVIPIRRLSA
jgi:prepilin-type N-terminal cleavage/methylation domain-containing protein